MNAKSIESIDQLRQADHGIDPIYLRRWSPRSFSDRKVEQSDLLGLFEAARWAPSASNEQPWRFIVATTEEERETFLTFINEGNRIWCAKAPVLALLVSASVGSRGNANRAHAFDSGTAWGFLALEATRRGLSVHAMGGFDAAKSKETLQIPGEYEPQIVIAIGYRGDAEALPEQLREREKPSARKPLSETLFRGSFGSTYR